MDIYFYEVFDEEAVALRRYLPADWTVGMTSAAIQETDHRSPPASVISTRTQSIIPPEWAPKLAGILSRSAGFDHLQRFLSSAPTRIPVGHLFAYSGRAVAEHAVLLWMALLHRLPRQLQAMACFQRDHLTGRECHGRTLCLFGAGDIGGHIASIGRGLGMRVLAVDPVRRWPDLTYVDKDTAVPEADVAVCAMNLNETNDRYFDPPTLAALKPGAVLVNVARGEFTRCTDVLDALTSGHLGGVGLDVYAAESIIAAGLRAGSPPDHPEYRAFAALRTRDDAILTPHNAFNTLEAVERKSQQSVRQLSYFRQHGHFSPVEPQET
ncbi:MAG TPA: NAD(P)-dependent oxidoreductase [Kiritimatiellia bacterium]|nr:NAD(P)-dependent oxidoreductase [Kiritimatiellia bacterium]HMP35259.1 NAD(P)-dependent oxidoreductase [Kiritimatiellia bacterium]